MKASEAKKLIGKRVTWERCFGYGYRPFVESAVFVEVSGRNVRDENGNWHWLPPIPDEVVVEDAP